MNRALLATTAIWLLTLGCGICAAAPRPAVVASPAKAKAAVAARPTPGRAPSTPSRPQPRPQPAPPGPAESPQSLLARGVLGTLLAAQDGPGQPPDSALVRTALALLQSEGIEAEARELSPPQQGCFLLARLPAAGPPAPALYVVVPLPAPAAVAVAPGAAAERPDGGAPQLVERAGQLSGPGLTGARGLAALPITVMKLLRREKRSPARELVLLLVPGDTAQAGAVLRVVAAGRLRGALVLAGPPASLPAASTVTPAAQAQDPDLPVPFAARLAEALQAAAAGDGTAALPLSCTSSCVAPPCPEQELRDAGATVCSLPPLPWPAAGPPATGGQSQQASAAPAKAVTVAGLTRSVQGLHDFLLLPVLGPLP